MDETYPGTDILVRICAGADCEKVVTELKDLWVDFDTNDSICTACRNASREYYDTEREWLLSIVPALTMLDNLPEN